MDGNGQPQSNTNAVLEWPHRVLAAADLDGSLNGHRELIVPAKAIITPLAAERLRQNGVQIRRQDKIALTPAATRRLGYAQDRPHGQVKSAVQALVKEGVEYTELRPATAAPSDHWARALAECVARGECFAGVVFCQDPGLVCCVANKCAGLRAVPVTTVMQTARALTSLAANLIVVEMPGRTFYEIRQILRLVCSQSGGCPESVACTLRELDGHAHR